MRTFKGDKVYIEHIGFRQWHVILELHEVLGKNATGWLPRKLILREYKNKVAAINYMCNYNNDRK